MRWTGRPRVTAAPNFLTGEAGVGKSRLAREVSQSARSCGLAVLTGRAVFRPVPVAFRPLTEAVLSGLRQRERWISPSCDRSARRLAGWCRSGS
jgi:hypothetical protein